MMKTNLNILYEDNHIIVVVKPKDILSQGDITGDVDMLTLIKSYIKETKNKPNDVYLGLVHRLDRRVGGVMVFGKTSKGASRLSEAIRNNEFIKKYLAICKGSLDQGEFRNSLEKIDNKAVESENGKESILKYRKIKSVKLDDVDFSLVEVDLITGRFNQIRSQFALNDHPLLGDYKYGYRGINYFDDIGLFSYFISFPHPITKEILEFKYLPKFGVWEKIGDIDEEI